MSEESSVPKPDRTVLSKPRDGFRVTSNRKLLESGNFGKNEGAYRPNETVAPVVETVSDLEMPEAVLEKRLSGLITNEKLENYFIPSDGSGDLPRRLVIDDISVPSGYQGTVDTGAYMGGGGGPVFGEELNIYRSSDGKFKLVTSNMYDKEQVVIDLDPENPYKTVAEYISKTRKEVQDGGSKWKFDFDPDVVVGRLEHQLEPEKHLPRFEEATKLLEVFQVRRSGEADPFMPFYTLEPDSLRKKEKSLVSELDGQNMVDVVKVYKQFKPQMDAVRRLQQEIITSGGVSQELLSYNKIFNRLNDLVNLRFDLLDRRYEATVWTLNESVVELFGGTRVKNNMNIQAIREEHRDVVANMREKISNVASKLISNGMVDGSPTKVAFDRIVRESGDYRLMAFPIVYDMDFSESDKWYREQVASGQKNVGAPNESLWEKAKKFIGF